MEDLSLGLSPVFGRVPDKVMNDAELDELLLGDLHNADVHNADVQNAEMTDVHDGADGDADAADAEDGVGDDAADAGVDAADAGVDAAVGDDDAADAADAGVEHDATDATGAGAGVVATEISFVERVPTVRNSSTAGLNIVVTHNYVSDKRQQFSVVVKTDKTAEVHFVSNGDASIASADVLRPVREDGTSAFTNERTGKTVKYCNIGVASREIAYLGRDLVVNWLVKSTEGLKNRAIIEDPAMAACVAALEKCVTLGDVRAFFKDWSPALSVFGDSGRDVVGGGKHVVGGGNDVEPPPAKRAKKSDVMDRVLAFYNDNAHPLTELTRFINGPSRGPEFEDFMLAAMRLPLRGSSVCASIDTMLCYV